MPIVFGLIRCVNGGGAVTNDVFYTLRFDYCDPHIFILPYQLSERFLFVDRLHHKSSSEILPWLNRKGKVSPTSTRSAQEIEEFGVAAVLGPAGGG